MPYNNNTKFNPDAYAAADPITKDILVKYLNAKGLYAMAEEKFDADVKALKPMYYEGEIKSGWHGEWTPSFTTVDIPYRKYKLLKKHNPEDLFFWVISGDLKQAWQIPGSAMTEERVSKKNTTRQAAEKFFRIPLAECELITLEGAI